MSTVTPEVQQAKQQAFCEAFALLGNITEAAQQAGIARNTHYGWLRPEENARAEEYQQMWEQAQERYKDQLRSEVHRRAVKGWTEPVFQKGMRVGAVRKYSDTLLIFHTKAKMPEEYRDQYTVRHEGEININALDAAIEQARQLKVINLEPSLIESGEGEENANG